MGLGPEMCQPQRFMMVLISWPKPMHHHKALGLTHFRLPETERISREVLSLPMNTELDNEQAEYVIESVRKFFKK